MVVDFDNGSLIGRIIIDVKYIHNIYIFTDDSLYLNWVFFLSSFALKEASNFLVENQVSTINIQIKRHINIIPNKQVEEEYGKIRRN